MTNNVCIKKNTFFCYIGPTEKSLSEAKPSTFVLRVYNQLFRNENEQLLVKKL